MAMRRARITRAALEYSCESNKKIGLPPRRVHDREKRAEKQDRAPQNFEHLFLLTSRGVGASGWAPSAAVLSRLHQFRAGEKVADFEGGRIGGVGTVRAIVLDAGAEFLADGAGRGFRGIGCAHGLAPFGDRAFRFESH